MQLDSSAAHRTQSARGNDRDNFVSALQIIDSMALLHLRQSKSGNAEIPGSMLEMVRKAAATYWDGLAAFESFTVESEVEGLQVLSVQIQQVVPSFERDSPLLQDESLYNVTGIISSLQSDDAPASGGGFVSITMHRDNDGHIDDVVDNVHLQPHNGSLSVMNLISHITHCVALPHRPRKYEDVVRRVPGRTGVIVVGIRLHRDEANHVHFARRTLATPNIFQ